MSHRTCHSISNPLVRKIATRTGDQRLIRGVFVCVFGGGGGGSGQT